MNPSWLVIYPLMAIRFLVAPIPGMDCGTIWFLTFMPTVPLILIIGFLLGWIAGSRRKIAVEVKQ